MLISSLLDTDLYKFTMQQLVFHRFPETPVEYTFRCRNANIDLRPYADEISTEVDNLCSLQLHSDELDYLASLPYFKAGYLNALRHLRLPREAVEISNDTEFRLKVRGDWFQTILFEVPLLAIINEVYFRNIQPPTEAVFTEGRRRLENKLQLAQEANLPNLQIMEFGTRRRYSRGWQEEVIERIAQSIPEHFLGTSNVANAKRLGLRCFGTMAHEYLQAFQAFEPLPTFQRAALDTWMLEYRGQLAIALSDIVGMAGFLRDFDLLHCKAYDGARHDSGDPAEWGEQLIAHYEMYGIAPQTKMAVFTDGLDFPTAIDLAKRFQGRIRTTFGIGTNLTNDLGFKALNIVIKMTRCNLRPVAKLSDSPGKAICDDPEFLNYLRNLYPL